MARIVYPAIPPARVTGNSRRMYHTHTASLMCVSHTRALPCVSLPPALSLPSFAPTFILRGCGFGHFGTTYPSRAGPSPFWWGTTYTYARVHTQAYTRRRAERCSKSQQGKVKARRRRGCAEEDWHKEGMVELIPESNMQREKDGERRGVVSRNVGTGEAT